MQGDAGHPVNRVVDKKRTIRKNEVADPTPPPSPKNCAISDFSKNVNDYFDAKTTRRLR
jgi:hypothetical protein